MKRTLKGGENYNRYFKNSSCTPTYLGTSDTAFTVSQMKAWAIKNAGQTKELSLSEFSRKNLQDTANSIYAFLYNHIQYELDGKRQNLKSPTCAWATRKQGADCKSYSIFASTILINLGIKHYFRRVKQPGMLPDKWTHVYVIVPKDQKSLKVNNPEDYYLIDATVHDNKEVRFTQKSDTLMSKVSLPHYGLQSPAIHGLAGCTCTPKASTTTVVRERPELQSSVNATRRNVTTSYNRPPGALENIRPVQETPNTRPSGSTVTREVTPDTTTRLRSNTTTPPVRATTAVTSARTSTVTGRTSRSLGAAYGGGYQRVGLGSTGGNIVTGLVQVAGNANQAAQNNRMAVSTGSRDQRLAAVGQSGATSATIQTIGAAAAPYTYGISAILTLIPADLYEKTLGQWFKDGFKCWGTTWTPTKAKTVSQIQIEYMKATALDTLQVFSNGTIAEVEQAINNYMLFAYSIQIGERHWLDSNDKKSKCTEEGLKVLIKVLDECIKEVVAAFKLAIGKAGHYLEVADSITHEYPPGGENSSKKSVVQKVPQYRIKINPAVYQQNSKSNPGTSIFNGGIQQAGFGTTGALIIAALIGGAYMYKNS